MRPVVIHRSNRDEAEQAISDLMQRGFEVIYPLTEFTRDGKAFGRDAYNRPVFAGNIFNSCWIAKLRRIENEQTCDESNCN